MASSSVAAAAVLLVAVVALSSPAVTVAQGNGRFAKTVKCNDKRFPACYHVKFDCPSDCSRSCFVDCQRCAPVCSCDLAGGVCQDPRFIGADGLTFYFHGRKDSDFCIVSERDLHINAHFIGRRNPMKTRDFTWIQSIGILYGDRRLYVGALKTTAWDDNADRLSISIDGEVIVLPEEEGAAWSSEDSAGISITRTAAVNGITVEARGKFRISATVVPITAEESRVHNYGVTADDCFAHLELAFKFHELSDDVHGVLGHTYRPDHISPFKASDKMPVMGGDASYASSGIFATDCRVARYRGGGEGWIAMATEKPRLSGFAG